MAKRSKDYCRHCNAPSMVDEDTFAPMGVCEACNAPQVQAAKKQRNAERRADREVVRVPKSGNVEWNCEDAPCCGCCGPANVRFVQTYRGEVAVNRDGEPL